MAEKTDVKSEPLPDLDELLQCPVCYEIPSGQIFQCNEGHHVCGRCKVRLILCPVCRAYFFGTRNYAMEELISNVRKLRAFKLGGKVTTGSSGSGSNTPAEEAASGENENAEEEDDNLNDPNLPALRAPQACKGLFRCLCCKNGNSIRLPSARLLNHLRYFHSPELIEGKSENGEYLQAWQFATIPGRIVTAVRVSDMGIFFLIIEISNDSLHAWLSMAAAPWVTNEFSYTVTISGNDREAIFSDCVWSVRSCEGFLKKRGRCLVMNGMDARALIAPASINSKLSIRRMRPDDIHQHLVHPRAVLRVANRGDPLGTARDASHDLEPFLQDLQNDVERLSRAFATLDREGNSLRARRENGPPQGGQTAGAIEVRASAPAVAEPPSIQNNPPENSERTMSRNARRRMRQRVRAALNITQSSGGTQRANGHVEDNTASFMGHLEPVSVSVPADTTATLPSSTGSSAPGQNNNPAVNPIRVQTGVAIVQQMPMASLPTGRANTQLGAVPKRHVLRQSVQDQTGSAIIQNASNSPRMLHGNGLAGASTPGLIRNSGSTTEASQQPSPSTASQQPANGNSNGQPPNGTRSNKKKRRNRK